MYAGVSVRKFFWIAKGVRIEYNIILYIKELKSNTFRLWVLNTRVFNSFIKIPYKCANNPDVDSVLYYKSMFISLGLAKYMGFACFTDHFKWYIISFTFVHQISSENSVPGSDMCLSETIIPV